MIEAPKHSTVFAVLSVPKTALPSKAKKPTKAEEIQLILPRSPLLSILFPPRQNSGCSSVLRQSEFGR